MKKNLKVFTLGLIGAIFIKISIQLVFNADSYISDSFNLMCLSGIIILVFLYLIIKLLKQEIDTIRLLIVSFISFFIGVLIQVSVFGSLMQSFREKVSNYELIELENDFYMEKTGHDNNLSFFYKKNINKGKLLDMLRNLPETKFVRWKLENEDLYYFLDSEDYKVEDKAFFIFEDYGLIHNHIRIGSDKADKHKVKLFSGLYVFIDIIVFNLIAILLSGLIVLAFYKKNADLFTLDKRR